MSLWHHLSRSLFRRQKCIAAMNARKVMMKMPRIHSVMSLEGQMLVILQLVCLVQLDSVDACDLS